MHPFLRLHGLHFRACANNFPQHFCHKNVIKILYSYEYRGMGRRLVRGYWPTFLLQRERPHTRSSVLGHAIKYPKRSGNGVRRKPDRDPRHADFFGILQSYSCDTRTEICETVAEECMMDTNIITGSQEAVSSLSGRCMMLSNA